MLRIEQPPTTAPRFLTAEWRNLVVLNYEAEPAVLAPFVPKGTELDAWEGKAFMSLVGFRFLNTRVLGMLVPFHRDFDEVNLRFYVRRKVEGDWRRGVVFVRELVPRRAVTWTARWLYGENYRTVPLAHEVNAPDADAGAVRRVAYRWTLGPSAYRLEVGVAGESLPFEPGGFEEFIIDQAWGYSGGAGRRTIEYRVEHPPWRLWPARARFAGDVAGLYGQRFVEPLAAAPKSAFLADGSPVTVFRGVRVA